MRPRPLAEQIVFCAALIFSSIPNLWASPPIALTITNFNRSGGTSVISWTAETNSFTNVFFNIQRATNLGGSFTTLTNVPENSGLVYTDSVSVASAAFYRIAQSNAFTTLTQPGAFTAYSASSVNGLTTVGYSGAVFDGRYVYFVPINNGTSYHGVVLRYDTQAGFTSASSWSAYDAGSTDGLLTRGYMGGVFDGRYVYFAPNYNGIVLRYDMQSAFSTASSWHAYDAGTTSGLNTKGYGGAVFDGRYVYFVPVHYGASAHGVVLRYDTQASFTMASSWSAYDAGSTDGLLTRGYFGGVFDGRFIYFVPYYNGSAFGIVLRYDTQSPFSTASSWHAYDAGATSGLNTKGYCGAVFDGHYVYFMPYFNGSSYQGVVLRYDTQASFTTASSWSAYDAGSTDGLLTGGYFGGVFDGRYICFVPEYNNLGNSGTVLRYDTQSPFSTSSSWHAYDAGTTSGLNAKGYEGAVSDGRYLYFAPLHNGSAFSGTVLRFDARLPRAVPPTVKGGSNF